MRFSTILAFMLPLAALAVPTPPSSARDLQAQLQQLNEARERFTNALIETSGAVNKTIDLATELKQSAVLDQVNKANDNLELAFLAALKVDADAKAGIQPSDDEYVDILRTYGGSKKINTAFALAANSWSLRTP